MLEGEKVGREVFGVPRQEYHINNLYRLKHSGVWVNRGKYPA